MSEQEQKTEKKVTREEAMMLQVRKTALTYFIPMAQKLMEAGHIQAMPNSAKLLFSAITKVDEALGNAKCTWADVHQTKLASALVNLVLLDLDLENNEAWAIPYKQGGKTVVQFPRSGLGEYKIRLQYGIKKPHILNAHIIREGDTFKSKYTSVRNDYEFEPILFSPKPIIGAFAFVEWEDGTTKLLVWDKDEIEKRRQASIKKIGKESDAWAKWTDKMILTKIVKAVFKNEPFKTPCAEIQNAINETDEDVIESAGIIPPNDKKIVLSPEEFEETLMDDESPAEPEKPEPEILLCPQCSTEIPVQDKVRYVENCPKCKQMFEVSRKNGKIGIRLPSGEQAKAEKPKQGSMLDN